MSELSYTLLQVWVLWYASAAAFGAFFGTMAALGVRALYRKLKSRRS
jgi:Na+/H+-dicarboxylate symporter